MSGASLPYHLRPHKAVDRRIFVDLLGRIERWQPLDDHVYVSMGAYPLEDHKLVHRVIGITRLLAFDYEDAVVARQKFNRPVGSCQCVKFKSGELIDNLDQILADNGFDDAAGVVAWLDYTDPKKLGEQVREFQSLLDKLSAGDVVRVTVNAHPRELIEQTSDRPIPTAEKRGQQFEALRTRIGEFLPSWATADHMTAEGLPTVIAEAFAKAALAAFPVGSDNTFIPLSIVRYADGLQMLSVTGMVIARDHQEECLERLGLETWPFASMDWSSVHHLVVPDLTLRERLFLEREIVSSTPAEIIDSLGFEDASGLAVADFIGAYKNYYRFYPTLLAAEV